MSRYKILNQHIESAILIFILLLTLMSHLKCNSEKKSNDRSVNNNCILSPTNQLSQWDIKKVNGLFAITYNNLWNKDFVALLDYNNHLLINYNKTEICGSVLNKSPQDHHLHFYGKKNETISIKLDTILRRYTNESVDAKCTINIKKTTESLACEFTIYGWLKTDSIFYN
ncbi:MAG: hypothetical protein KDC82_08565 [Bacteroidetes bacterium]|nr:hypothetical protein [Bacteroidota bacterium]